LIENCLCLCVRLRDQVFGVVYVPEQFAALQSLKETGLGNVQRFAHGGSGNVQLSLQSMAILPRCLVNINDLHIHLGQQSCT
jgi:hypothetical protein